MVIKRDRLYRPDELAEYLGVTVKTIRNYINEPLGNLKSYKLSKGQKGPLRVKGSDFLEWLESKENICY